MKNGFADPYAVCPLYSKESTNEARKIYCKGHINGIFIHLYFKDMCLKKEHKSNYCKRIDNYKECPFYKSIIESCEDMGNG